MAAAASGDPAVGPAAVFVIQVDGVPVANFSELSGITTEVEPAYIDPASGGIVHPKQYGKTKPPQVTLKRGFDSDTYLWSWHQEVLAGDPAGRRTCSLQMFEPSQSPESDQPTFTYVLENAWPSKIEIGGVKAGGLGLATETVVFVCDQIVMQPGG